MRAIRARYHPYVQARARVDQLRRLGHTVDKVTAQLTSYSRRSCWAGRSLSGLLPRVGAMCCGDYRA